MQKVYKQYRQTLKKVNKQLEAMPTRDENGAPDPNRQYLSSAASDLRYTIHWMEKGSPPPTRTERLSKQQREVLSDPQDYRFLVRVRKARAADDISPDKRERLEALMAKLSPREREVFMLVYGQSFTESSAAEILGISRSSINTLIKRARKKLMGCVQKEAI
jgi:RNA polymerase sigma-70 factor (ECF subfamily)